ncbi:PIN domain-containing protein [Patescibacteria group bacterium AH-259-L07]|nr:PIN domain-containing protein [Patescibacteria group bacterium AH-259-L07]
MKGSSYFLDTNIFLRVIFKDDDRKAKECQKLFEKIKIGGLKAFTSHLVLAEIVWAGKTCNLSKQEIVIILKGILNFKNLKIIDTFDLAPAIENYEAHNIKFIDALIASIASIYKKNTTIVSYDKDFDKLKLKRVEPSDLIK